MNKLKSPTIQRNMPPKKAPSMLDRATWDPGMIFQMRQIPTSDAFLEHLTFKLIDWAKNNKDALTFDQFLSEFNLTWEGVNGWRKRYPRLELAWQYAKVCISARREVGGLKNTLNSAMVMKTMPMYSDQWVDLIKWYEKLREGTESRGSHVTVVMEPIPSIEEQK
jgi:hypothetical protein